MSLFSELGQSVRKRLLDSPLPFDFINTQIQKWQNSDVVDEAAITDETVDYLTPVLIASGVGIGIAFLLPIMASFISLDCCCGLKDKKMKAGAQTLDNSLNSRRTSLIRVGPRWLKISLVVLSFGLGVLIITLVTMLLVANQAMHSGMDGASNSASGVLGQMEDYVNDYVTEFGVSTVDRSSDIYNTLKRDTLLPLSHQVFYALADEFETDALQLVSRIKWAGQQASRTDSLLTLVNDTTHNLQGSLGRAFLRKLNELTDAVETVVKLCNQSLMDDPSTVVSPPTQKLLSVCQQIVDQSSLLVPEPSGVVSEVFASLPSVYVPMKQIREVVNYDLIEAGRNRSTYFYNDILRHVETDVQLSVNDALRHGEEGLQSAERYFSDMKRSLSDMLNDSFGLPESKQTAKDSINKYVVAYEQYRFDLSCLLCSAILITVVVLLGSTAVGAWKSKVPEEMTAAMRDQSHFSGRLLMKLESVFLLLIALSLVLFAVLVFVASVLGESCGSHNNFTEIIEKVVDKKENWNGYLLSKDVLQLEDDDNDPLTVYGAMIDCDQAKAAWNVFHLHKKWNLDALLNFTDALTRHLDDVAAVEAPPVDLLGAEANRSVHDLIDAGVLSVEWRDCLDLSTSVLYVGTTGNFTRLRDAMILLNSAAAEKTGSPTHADIIVALQRIRDKLHPVETEQTTVEMAKKELNTACDVLQGFNNVQTAMMSDLQQFARFNNKFNGPLGASAVLSSPVELAISRVSGLLETHKNSTKLTIEDELGVCLPLRETYNTTVYSTCDDYMSGMDQFWASLAINVIVMLFAMFLSHHLAYFFLDQEQWRQPKKFIFYKSVVYRMLSSAWFLLDYTLNVIIVYRLGTDDFHMSYCCPVEVQATGITLVSIIGILIIPMHVYIFGLLVKAQDAKNATIESFWVFRKHAFQFFSNLFCFFLQDTAFIVLTGIYIQVVGYADAVSVAALIVTLLGALGFISNSAGQRTGNIRRYFKWLKFSLTSGHCMTANESVEERSHVFQDTEVTSQCGVPGQYSSQVLTESTQADSRQRANSKFSNRRKESKPQWWEEETSFGGAVAVPLSQSCSQPGQQQQNGTKQQHQENFLAEQRYIELSIDQPARIGHGDDPESPKRVKRRLSSKQRSRQRLTEEAISSESDGGGNNGRDLARRPPFRRSSRRSRSARKAPVRRRSGEYAYDATWERPVNRPGICWSDDEATLRRSGLSHHSQHRKAGLSVEV